MGINRFLSLASLTKKTNVVWETSTKTSLRKRENPNKIELFLGESENFQTYIKSSLAKEILKSIGFRYLRNFLFQR